MYTAQVVWLDASSEEFSFEELWQFSVTEHTATIRVNDSISVIPLRNVKSIMTWEN